MTYKKPVPEIFWKQPWETYLIGADNSRVLEDGDYIDVTASDIVAEDVDGNDVTATILNNNYKMVTTADADDIKVDPVTNGMLVTRVQGGVEASSPYKITFKAVTNNGDQFETDTKMKVRDI